MLRAKVQGASPRPSPRERELLGAETDLFIVDLQFIGLRFAAKRFIIGLLGCTCEGAARSVSICHPCP